MACLFLWKQWENRMNIKNGDLVRYNYPEPRNAADKEFVGTVEDITESYIIIKNKKNIRLKISSKNYEMLESTRKAYQVHLKSENFYG